MGQEKAPLSARSQAEKLQHEIAALREEIGADVDELDRRRKELMDVRLQLQKHALPIALAGGAVVLLAAGGAALAVWKHRRDQRPAARMKRLGQAARRVARHPEYLARPEQSLSVKLLTAALTALAGATAKKLVERAFATELPHLAPGTRVHEVAILPELRA